MNHRSESTDGKTTETQKAHIQLFDLIKTQLPSNHTANLSGFSDHSDPRQLYIDCPGHFSQDGHELAAELIESFLTEHSVLPG